MNGYLIALAVFLAWLSLLYVGHKTKWLERHSMSPYGPFIMWKTKKGRELVDRLSSRKRFWGAYARIALWICAGSMILITVLLLWEATLVSKVAKAPSPELILGIPGLNPVIPLGYGILGLAIAIVVHELSHGIMTRLGGMKVISLGLLFLVFPMGAFVEPDEKELQAASRSKRSKVYAAGPATNIVVAMVFLLLFSNIMMTNVQPTHEGALATGVVEDSPAYLSGISAFSVITSIDGVPITSSHNFTSRESLSPGSTVTVQYYFKGALHTASNVTDGVVVAYTTAGFAASEYGLKPGMVLRSINDTLVGNLEGLSATMNLTRADKFVNATVMSYDASAGRFVVNGSVTQILLSDKHAYYAKYYPGENKEEYRGMGYLGAGFLPMGVSSRDANYYSGVLANPFAGDRSLHDFSMSWLRLIALPFLDLAPIRSPVSDLYHPSGSLAWMPDTMFWLLANSFYWIFWLNLMVGLTNVLPAVPLDGGYLFRDALDYVVSRIRGDYTKEKRENVVGSLTLMVALAILFLIVWQLVGPAI